MSKAETYQTPEQKARVNIDAMLEQSGWNVQHKNKIDFGAGPGIAVREYQTDVGPADYVLFVDSRAVGVIEAKPEPWGQKITTVEEQSGGYAAAKLKWVSNKEPLPFIYESTGVLTRFTDSRDPKPRSREVFAFPRPETMQEGLASQHRCGRDCRPFRLLIQPACGTVRSQPSKIWRNRLRTTAHAP